jgi:LysM repeat protein
MKKHLIAIGISVFIFANSWSQTSPLLVEGTGSKLYLQHAVEAGENWYSIGRIFNVGPKDMAPYNGQSLDKPLSIGQVLKVPLTVINFSQDGSKGTGEVLVPLYHIVQEKEWLYRISTNYNSVSVENLEKWNHVNRDHVKKGMQLIVGFLKVKASQSTLAKYSINGDVMAGAPADIGPKKEELVTTTSNLSKSESRPLSNTPDPVEPKPVSGYASTHPAGGGYFHPDFIAGNGSVGGEAGIFKSTSGWQDGKYYALMNNVQVGTIVKVTNPSNHKTVYAKILGQLPDMKESAGLVIRISNAAASELATDQLKFTVEVKY